MDEIQASLSKKDKGNLMQFCRNYLDNGSISQKVGLLNDQMSLNNLIRIGYMHETKNMPTEDGLDYYFNTADSEHNPTIKKVGDLIANEGKTRSFDISSSLQLSALVVNPALRFLEKKHYLSLNRFPNGELLISDLSPEFMRIFKK